MSVLEELEARGFVKQLSDREGLAAALTDEQVTFYVGFDPTANSLHVGHMLPVMAMAHLQRAGHRALAIVGGGTGMVGDPSGKTEARMLLDEPTIHANLLAMKGQLSRFLEFDEAGEKGVMLNNADWLLELNYVAFLREIGSVFSVNRMLAAEGYKIRLERGLSFIEFNYQLLQAYDFLTLYRDHGCRLQIGGDDQWGNILAGVDLIRRKEQATGWALTIPLLTTATGQKMGKTHSGAVWLSAERMPPFDFYQYWINVDDRDVVRFLKLYTFLPLEEIAQYAEVTGAAMRDVKSRLAWEVTALVHGEDAANHARDGAAAMVAGEAADDLPTHTIHGADLEGGLPFFVVLADCGLARSRGEARRHIKGGAVRLANEKIEDPEARLTASAFGVDGVVLRVGKKRAVRLVCVD